MTRYWTFALALAALTCGGGPLGAGEGPKTRILLIGKDPDHPYGTHMYMHACRVLAKCLERTPGVEAVVSNGWPKDEATLKGVKAIVVYTSPAAELLLTGPHKDQVDKMMKDADRKARLSDCCQLLYDQAMLVENHKIEDPVKFANLLSSLIIEAYAERQ